MRLTPLLLALLLGFSSCAPQNPQPTVATDEWGKKTYTHKGKFATYHAEVTFGSAFKHLHFSTFVVNVERPDDPFDIIHFPNIAAVFTHYDLEGAHAISHDDYDAVIFVNGQSTGEEGHADGTIIIGRMNHTSGLSWNHWKGEVTISGDASADTQKLAKTLIEEFSLKNDSWRW